VRVDKTVTIHRPIAEVFSFWRHFENLPRFMRHLESVSIRDNLHSHWVANTLGGKLLEWDAEIIEQKENEMISWRSAPGADVDNAGSVWFTKTPTGEGTQIRVELKYIPPAGTTGVLIAKAFRRDASAEIEEDLQRLKSLLETGRIPEPASAQKLKRAAEAARKAARAADTRIRENPWTAIGSAAIAGLALGFLMGLQGGSRNRREERFEMSRSNGLRLKC
jgi:uncharacterized membrane protein